MSTPVQTYGEKTNPQFFVSFKTLDDIRVNLSRTAIFNSHRSGWKYALQSLAPIRNDNMGIFVDDFIERSFSWDRMPVGEKEISYDNITWYVKYSDIRSCPDTDENQKTHAVIHPSGFVIRWSTFDQKWVKCSINWDSLLPAFSQNVVYEYPWIGIWHNPPDSRAYTSSIDLEHSPINITRHPEFIASLMYCKGIFVLSETMAQWVRYKFSKMGFSHIPVSCLYHPTEPVAMIKRFSYDAFISNKRKRLIQIGHWLRDLSAIWRLRNTADFIKTFLYGDKYAIKRFLTEDYLDKNMETKRLLQEILEDTSCRSKMVKMFGQCVDIMKLSDTDYDDMLSNNIVFVRLLGSSCNNTVIECMARGTPLLINRLDAVVEYLGCDYPFYYNDLEEASQKVVNMNLIRRTAEYLNSWSMTSKMTGVNFLSDFCNNNIMRSLVNMPIIPTIYPKFDFIITWVNNNDRAWQDSFHRDLQKFINKHKPFCKFLPHKNLLTPDSITSNRYRCQFDELKYCIRAIESCCGAYIRRVIIIVHDDQSLPSWLNINSRDLRIIRHKELFTMAGCPKGYPSYNSLAIEACIPSIPDITETFIYLNDDVFLLGRWTDADFVRNGKLIFYTENHEIARTEEIRYSFDYMWKNNHKFLDKKCGKKPRYVLQHAPYVISASQCRKIKNKIVYTTQKMQFRTIEDIGLLCGVNQYLAYHDGRAESTRINVYYLNPKNLSKDMRIVPPEARVLCIQDDNLENADNLTKFSVIQTLETLYPEPSNYEL